GNILLLAGLGVGAFMLFSKKSNAATSDSSNEMPTGNGGDIPNAPKIFAVNSSSTESPLPTGIVSDEDGMEATGDSNTDNESSGNSEGYSDQREEDSNVTSTPKKYSPAKVHKSKKTATAGNDIPALVSTILTPKEKDIINKGKLTAALAIKRPDLYKAAYIKRFGGKTATSKRAALIKASFAIDAAVNAAKASKNGGLKKAQKYPAKPEFTFVQNAGGMAVQAVMNQMAMLQNNGVKVSPAAHKVAAQVKAAKAGTARRPATKPHLKTKHPTHKTPMARASHPVKPKRQIIKKSVPQKHR
ncbi:MAG: hypothetical protein ABI169_14535, partial [Chitinophagaceae bacterium]